MQIFVDISVDRVLNLISSFSINELEKVKMRSAKNF